jgi:hypothetical protein
VAAIDTNDPENLKVRTPVRVEQGADDGTVFKAFTDQLVDQYKAAGAGDATKWIRGRFRR